MDANKKGAPKMSDEERAKLVKKLDDDMEKYLAQLEAKAKRGPGYQDGWDESKWEEEFAKHPFFASTDAIIEDAAKGQLNPLMEGLQNLKYSPDENTAEELAKNYKEDGNFQFKLKKYRLAVAAYTEGIRCKSGDDLINVQLITNRAAAQFHLGNYRSSFNDCKLAIKLKPDHLKALKRGAICCYRLKRLPDCIEWCEKVLVQDSSDKEITEILTKAKSEVKEAERNARKQSAQKKKQFKDNAKLLKSLQSRNLTLKGIDWKSLDFANEDVVYEAVDSLVPKLGPAMQKRVHFSSESGKSSNTLIWPVLFMYPEYGETDLIEEFEETGQCFDDHLQAMFGHGIERPVWDIQNKYHPERLKIYYEDRVTNPDKVALVPLKDTNLSLGEVIADPKFEIINGLPTFIVLVEKSAYETVMIKTYENPHLK